MFAMRHFPDLVNIAPKKEPSREKPTVKEPNPILWYEFAQLALNLGFRSPKITQMSSAQALKAAIQACLVRVADYTNDRRSIESRTAEIQDNYGADTEGNPVVPPLTTDQTDLDLQRRYGRPFKDAQQDARAGPFTKYVYGIDEPNGRYITSLFVLRSTFQAFFGDDRSNEQEDTAGAASNLDVEMDITDAP